MEKRILLINEHGTLLADVILDKEGLKGAETDKFLGDYTSFFFTPMISTLYNFLEKIKIPKPIFIKFVLETSTVKELSLYLSIKKYKGSVICVLDTEKFYYRLRKLYYNNESDSLDDRTTGYINELHGLQGNNNIVNNFESLGLKERKINPEELLEQQEEFIKEKLKDKLNNVDLEDQISVSDKQFLSNRVINDKDFLIELFQTCVQDPRTLNEQTINVIAEKKLSKDKKRAINLLREWIIKVLKEIGTVEKVLIGIEKNSELAAGFFKTFSEFLLKSKLNVDCIYVIAESPTPLFRKRLVWKF